MAEILSIITESILKKLGERVLEEIGLLRHLADELGKLQATVLSIHTLLRQAEMREMRSRTSDRDKLWLTELKDVVYDADDLLDDISTEASRRKHKSDNVVTRARLFFSSSNKLVYGLRMAHEVNAIREKLTEVNANYRTYNLDLDPAEELVDINLYRETHSCTPAVVIGRDDDKSQLLKLLFADHREDLVVIPVFGLGGTGKTTLAQIVFNDQTVKEQFDLRAWICVSTIFEVKSIIRNLIECIGGRRPDGNSEMEALQMELRERVKGKKYLFVLDDVWQEDREKWFSLINLINNGARGSRIIVTTRSMLVAKITDTGETYELKGLSQRASWDLFRQVAFKRGQQPSKEFEELGMDIAAKCCGFPLAIRTIGSLLYTKKKESEWRYFRDHEIAKFDAKANILETLKLSYNHLPSKLKCCFAYCSLFPKGCEIDASLLISYWKAQGYVDAEREGTTSQDHGVDCLMYLLERCFLQVEKVDENGEILTCRMHDYMHDLSKWVAGEEVVSGCFDGRVAATAKTRHLSLHGVNNKLDVAPLLQGKKARTLIIQTDHRFVKIGKKDCRKILDELRYLRVLSLHNFLFKKLPSSIEKLKHLRELDLSWNLRIRMLPKSITRLHNLQELNLDGCCLLEKLPRKIKKLVNLIRLGVAGCTNLQEMPRGIGKLTSLEVLSRFILSRVRRGHATGGGLDELQGLNMLRGKLKICNLQFVEKGASGVAKLKEKSHLRALSLQWDLTDELEDIDSIEKTLEALEPHGNLRKLTLKYYGGVMFPKWLSSLQNLVSVKIDGGGKCKYLPSFDRLPSIEHLEVRGLRELEYLLNNGNTKKADTSNFFPKLQTLILWKCPELKGWWSTSTMEEPLHYQVPFLSKLQVWLCPNFKGCMPRLPSLNTLTLLRVSAELLEETLKQAKAPSTKQTNEPSTSTAASFFHLQSLSIWEIEGLGVMHEEALRSLASVRSLQIFFFSDASFFSQWLPYLTSLERLSIHSCEMNLPETKNIRLIQHLIPEGINLRFLRIENCKKMKSLPEVFQYVNSLETLEILHCKELESLPRWVGNLTSLNRLEIHGCPTLSERCGSQGADWPSISHIPYIKVSPDERDSHFPSYLHWYDPGWRLMDASGRWTGRLSLDKINCEDSEAMLETVEGTSQ